MLLAFVTGYVGRDGLTVTDQTMILRNYARTWLLVDVVAILPFQFLSAADLGHGGSEDASSLSRVARIPRLLQLLRLLRLAKVVSVLRKIGRTLRRYLSPAYSRMALTLLFSCLFLHFVACLWWFIGSQDLIDNPGAHNWITDEGMSPDDLSFGYVSSLYYVLCTVSTLGPGDIIPLTIQERIFAVFLIFFGAIWFGVLISGVRGFLSELDSSNKQSYERRRQVLSFSRHHKLGPRLTSRMVASFDAITAAKHLAEDGDDDGGYHFDSNLVLANVAPEIRVEIVLSVNKHILSSFPALQRQSRMVQAYVLQHVRRGFAVGGEVLAPEGDHGDCLFLIASGYVVLTHEHVTIAEYGRGAIIGEIDCLYAPSRLATIQATSACEYYTLSRSYLHKMCEKLPTFASWLHAVAAARVKQYEGAAGKRLPVAESLHDAAASGTTVTEGYVKQQDGPCAASFRKSASKSEIVSKQERGSSVGGASEKDQTGSSAQATLKSPKMAGSIGANKNSLRLKSSRTVSRDAPGSTSLSVAVPAGSSSVAVAGPPGVTPAASRSVTPKQLQGMPMIALPASALSASSPQLRPMPSGSAAFAASTDAGRSNQQAQRQGVISKAAHRASMVMMHFGGSGGGNANARGHGNAATASTALTFVSTAASGMDGIEPLRDAESLNEIKSSGSVAGLSAAVINFLQSVPASIANAGGSLRMLTGSVAMRVGYQGSYRRSSGNANGDNSKGSNSRNADIDAGGYGMSGGGGGSGAPKGTGKMTIMEMARMRRQPNRSTNAASGSTGAVDSTSGLSLGGTALGSGHRSAASQPPTPQLRAQQAPSAMPSSVPPLAASASSSQSRKGSLTLFDDPSSMAQPSYGAGSVRSFAHFSSGDGSGGADAGGGNRPGSATSQWRHDTAGSPPIDYSNLNPSTNDGSVRSMADLNLDAATLAAITEQSSTETAATRRDASSSNNNRSNINATPRAQPNSASGHGGGAAAVTAGPNTGRSPGLQGLPGLPIAAGTIALSRSSSKHSVGTISRSGSYASLIAMGTLHEHQDVDDQGHQDDSAVDHDQIASPDLESRGDAAGSGFQGGGGSAAASGGDSATGGELLANASLNISVDTASSSYRVVPAAASTSTAADSEATGPPRDRSTVTKGPDES